MGVYNEAYATVQTVETTVLDRITYATTMTDMLTLQALDTLDRLKNVNLEIDTGNLPSPPRDRFEPDTAIELPVITPRSFGIIDIKTPVLDELEDAGTVRDINIEEFKPSIRGLAIPEPPTPTNVLRPTRPDFDYSVAFPAKPNLALPPTPVLTEIIVPSFSGLTIPTFNGTEPEFEGTPVSAVLQWQEPTYQPEIIGEVLEKIRLLWSGSLGIPPEIEKAIVDRAIEREDMLVRQQVSEAAVEFSSRGFTTMSGPQAARIDQIRQDALLKKQGANREFAIKFAELQIENVKFAIQQGIAAENVFVNIFLNAANRLFEAAKFHVESLLNIYNAQVAIFNARMNALSIRVEVFKARLQAELSKLDVFKAEIEAEIARGTINEQKVRTYTAQIQAVTAQIDIFKAETEAAAIKSDAIKNQIEAYRTDVQAYAAELDADKLRFEAYQSRIQGEVVKAGIIEAESRAYTALIQGKASIVDVDAKRADIILDKNRIKLQKYTSDLEAVRTQLQAQVSVIDAAARSYTAETQKFVAVAQAETARAQLNVTAEEAQMRANIAFYEAKVQAYISSREQMIRKSQISVSALEAAGSLSGTLAAGAMAGVHVGATLTGSGSVNASGSSASSTNYTESFAENRNYNYEGT